jgi:hypothetical protein
MSVRITNRFRRIAYIVVLLTLAVALPTALVGAGERNAASQTKNVLQQDLHSTHSTVLEKGDRRCAAA